MMEQIEVHANYHLLASKGSGSAIVELALVLAGLDYEAEYIEFRELGPDCGRVTPYSPLGQVPVLICPDGSVLTETAAIILTLHDLCPDAGLVPSDDAERRAFHRWLIYLVATLYPTFTYGDNPGRWVAGEDAGKGLRTSTDAARDKMWRFVEDQTSPAPWFLGQAFSALDLYAAVMTRWRPGRDWFRDHCPKLHGVSGEVQSLPALEGVLRRNFG